MSSLRAFICVNGCNSPRGNSHVERTGLLVGNDLAYLGTRNIKTDSHNNVTFSIAPCNISQVFVVKYKGTVIPSLNVRLRHIAVPGFQHVSVVAKETTTLWTSQRALVSLLRTSTSKSRKQYKYKQTQFTTKIGLNNFLSKFSSLNWYLHP